MLTIFNENMKVEATVSHLFSLNLTNTNPA